MNTAFGMFKVFEFLDSSDFSNLESIIAQYGVREVVVPEEISDLLPKKKTSEKAKYKTSKQQETCATGEDAGTEHNDDNNDDDCDSDIVKTRPRKEAAMIAMIQQTGVAE